MLSLTTLPKFWKTVLLRLYVVTDKTSKMAAIYGCIKIVRVA